jgi:hypothetical protein
VVLVLILDGQVITGSWISFTVTVKEQAVVFPDTSVARQTTVLIPLGNGDPLANPDILLKVTLPLLQLSLAVTEYVATAVQRFASVFLTIGAGQLIVGS